MLDSLGLVDLLLPELASLKGLPQPKRYHLYDAYEHSLKAYEYAPPRLRFAALVHDVGKAEAVRLNGNMHDHAQIGAQMAEKICKRFKMPTAEQKRIVRLVALHMTDINGDTSTAKLRRFVALNYDIILIFAILWTQTLWRRREKSIEKTESARSQTKCNLTARRFLSKI